MKSFLFCLFALVSVSATASEQAEKLFDSLRPALFQIRLIELASGEKSSIGSGFMLDARGRVATNYHVISDYVHYPDKYRVEYLDQNNNKGELTLLAVDVVNDLAILKREGVIDTFFPLAKTAPSQGSEVFSLGNPHDLGMIVVPGTYNGLKKDSFYDRIHFTGAVNPGMSGGPAVNEQEEVIGINVATSGNQIGFLVPVEKLQTLYAQLPQTEDVEVDIKQQINQQLKHNQHQLLSMLLEGDWQPRKLGEASAPGSMTPFIRCWGDSNADKKDAFYFSALTTCRMDGEIFLSNEFRTGNVLMQYNWLESNALNSLHFYNLYEKRINNVGPNNQTSSQDVTNFRCQNKLVQQNEQGIKSKAIFCARAYKEYKGLYDILFVGASIDKEDKALITHFTLSGVEQSLGQTFTQKFMESTQWN